MNIDQISELLRLLREINERLARIEGIVQQVGVQQVGMNEGRPRFLISRSQIMMDLARNEQE